MDDREAILVEVRKLGGKLRDVVERIMQVERARRVYKDTHADLPLPSLGAAAIPALIGMLELAADECEGYGR